MFFYAEQHKLALNYTHIIGQETKKQIPGGIVKHQSLTTGINNAFTNMVSTSSSFPTATEVCLMHSKI